ncbi:MAG: DUF2202 domain-containing protein [Atribacterota bacterium]|nr:DUF2202 domain-containing protein [Atribacterota bacterium]MDD4896083.1 DUF2202 domain-containing protein [Atribacterota bacterium]MDD5637409.1 DUF2202 domain-containing protein [Atribacterota bacterium]
MKMRSTIKGIITLVVILVITGLVMVRIFAQGTNATFERGIFTTIRGMETGPLSSEEIEGILLMREEEKLAREVYTALYEKWNLRTFESIGQGSETTHMDAMKMLLDRYNLEDPVGEDIPGVFQNGELQKAYDELVAKGSRSIQDAILVGAYIEDLDIYDLERLIKETDNDDIKIVYQNLLKGSRNHLRAFDRQLQRYNLTYEAQFLTQEEYDRIAASRQESGGAITDPNFKF